MSKYNAQSLRSLLQEIANKRLACLEDMAKIAGLEDLFGVSVSLCFTANIGHLNASL